MATNDIPHGIQRGQIRLVDWSPGRGSEQTGKRPAVVVQNNAGNRAVHYTNTIVVTVSTKGKPVPSHVLVRRTPGNGLRSDSFVKCEQVLTISKSRLIGKPWGILDASDLARIDRALKLSLALT